MARIRKTKDGDVKSSLQRKVKKQKKWRQGGRTPYGLVHKVLILEGLNSHQIL